MERTNECLIDKKQTGFRCGCSCIYHVNILAIILDQRAGSLWGGYFVVSTLVGVVSIVLKVSVVKLICMLSTERETLRSPCMAQKCLDRPNVFRRQLEGSVCNFMQCRDLIIFNTHAYLWLLLLENLCNVSRKFCSSCRKEAVSILKKSREKVT